MKTVLYPDKHEAKFHCMFSSYKVLEISTVILHWLTSTPAWHTKQVLLVLGRQLGSGQPGLGRTWRANANTASMVAQIQIYFATIWHTHGNHQACRLLSPCLCCRQGLLNSQFFYRENPVTQICTLTNIQFVFRRDAPFRQDRRHSGEWRIEDFTFQGDSGVHRYKHNQRFSFSISI